MTTSTILTILRSSLVLSLQVDDRLGGDGTGLAFGVNDPVLGWHMAGVFATIWAVFYLATRELGGKSDDSGLSL